MRCISENYRTINLTSIVCNVFGGNGKGLTEICDKGISDNQHGFMKGHACQTNQFSFYEGVNEKLVGGSPVGIVYLDFAKVFYTVPHKCLNYKIRSVGVDEAECT